MSETETEPKPGEESVPDEGDEEPEPASKPDEDEEGPVETYESVGDAPADEPPPDEGDAGGEGLEEHGGGDEA